MAEVTSNAMQTGTSFYSNSFNQTAQTFQGFNTKYSYKPDKWIDPNTIHVLAISDDTKENISGFENSAHQIQEEYMKKLESQY